MTSWIELSRNEVKKRPLVINFEIKEYEKRLLTSNIKMFWIKEGHLVQKYEINELKSRLLASKIEIHKIKKSQLESKYEIHDIKSGLWCQNLSSFSEKVSLASKF